jgi:large subunit ribosomal protein L35
MPRNSTNPKKKLKTHRGARKRFKITATGKIKRMHSGKRHLLGTKKPGRMRKLKKLTLVSESDVRTLRQMLPYGWTNFFVRISVASVRLDFGLSPGGARGFEGKAGRKPCNIVPPGAT